MTGDDKLTCMIPGYDISEFRDLSVADVVLSCPSSRQVLLKYDIDFCCGGHKSFIEACEDANVAAENIWKEIQSLNVKGFNDTFRITEWNLGFLTEYIEENHHTYAKRVIPEIRSLLDETCTAHGEDHPLLLEVADDFSDLCNELLSHMEREEKLLFPIIRRLFSKKGSFVEDMPLPQHFLAPLAVMEEEHNLAGDLIRSIRKLTNNYTAPREASATFRLTFQRLQKFDEDLMMHIFIENNLLFEKVNHKNKNH